MSAAAAASLPSAFFLCFLSWDLLKGAPSPPTAAAAAVAAAVAAPAAALSDFLVAAVAPSAAAATGLSPLLFVCCCFAVEAEAAAGLRGLSFGSEAALACFFDGWEGAAVGVSFRLSALRFLLDCVAGSGSSRRGSSIYSTSTPRNRSAVCACVTMSQAGLGADLGTNLPGV